MTEFPPVVDANTRAPHRAAIAVGFLVQHLARPESGTWLRAVVDLDVVFLAWVRASTNIQASNTYMEPGSTWEPLWRDDLHLTRLQQQLDRSLVVFREHLSPDGEDITVIQRREILLDTLFQICRSLFVGLSMPEAVDILERWLTSKGRRPVLWYRTVVVFLAQRIEVLERENPPTQR
jgi:hypothetical protein